MTRIKPGLEGAVLRTSRDVYFFDGVPQRQIELTVTPEQFEEYRQGYRCPLCHGIQSEPFPEQCETVWKDTNERCPFRIKRDLAAWLELNFRGEETLWPRAEIDREREDWQAKTGIWLPGDEE